MSTLERGRPPPLAVDLHAQVEPEVLQVVHRQLLPLLVLELETKVIRRFAITEEAPTRTFSWLKVPISAFTFKTHLRHYAKQVPKHNK